MIKFIKAFGFAFNGLIIFFKHETNGRVQGIVAIIALILSIYFHISTMEYMWIFACICIVIALEMMNSAIEKMCNIISTDFHPTIKVVKDICAGAVLWASFFSLVIGCIIFLPKIFR
jgi:diacylglycerol kinase